AAGGTIKVVEALVPVLDEVRLAQENGDVSGPFEAHVNKLLDALAKVGVEQYGAVGDEFDPRLHEALMQQPSDDVEVPTVFMVMQPGYRMGDRIIRAARVGVQQGAQDRVDEAKEG
ncbi:nucleotide exchange factor GrpE, partial [Mycobacterium tuberculosis]|nr:nucleotide exchange factor GrpE [Mycobacterium tuberculosis]